MDDQMALPLLSLAKLLAAGADISGMGSRIILYATSRGGYVVKWRHSETEHHFEDLGDAIRAMCAMAVKE